MSKTGNMVRLFNSAQTFIVKHTPEILTGLGVASMITSTVLAVKATPKALALKQEAEKRKADKLTPVEVVKATWKCYIPSAVTGVAGAACIVGASSVHLRRNAALATAYKLSETALTEYKAKVVETIGEKKEKQVQEKVDKERVEKTPVSNTEVIITEKGNTLCLDTLSHRYFTSDIERIRRAENDLNYTMINDMSGYVSLNDLYYELGLEQIPVGDDLGWNIGRGKIKIDFSSQITDDGRPCVVLNYMVAPRRDYMTFV